MKSLSIFIILVLPYGLVWFVYRRALLGMTSNWPEWKAVCLMAVSCPIYIGLGLISERWIWLAPFAALGMGGFWIGVLVISARILSSLESYKSKI